MKRPTLAQLDLALAGAKILAEGELPDERPTWERTDPPRPQDRGRARHKFATWRHRSGYLVKHCGHPTALYPWYILAPADAPDEATCGKTYQLLKDAKARAEELAAHPSWEST